MALGTLEMPSYLALHNVVVNLFFNPWFAANRTCQNARRKEVPRLVPIDPALRRENVKLPAADARIHPQYFVKLIPHTACWRVYPLVSDEPAIGIQVDHRSA